ncbi:MAG: hypothetical protein P8N43_11105 [Alphaproteobacteria bacterium]|nr:hypothetical protein [Alphaproteobacteria bacterium]
MKIVADTALLENRLRDHVDLSRSLGGWVREDLIIRCEEGNLSLACTGESDVDTPLITMPSASLVPVD